MCTAKMPSASYGKTLRVAWLITKVSLYWQPLLSHYTHSFPKMTVFTGAWPGYASGCEQGFTVRVVGHRRILRLSTNPRGYGRTLIWLSLKIIPELVSYRPQLVILDAFSLWTAIALALKLVLRWKAIITFDGISPGNNRQESRLRLFFRRGMVTIADACITNTWSGQNYLTKTLRADPAKILVHPYLVPEPRALDPADSLTAVSLNQPSVFTFLYIGQLIPRKGLRCLILACAMLRSRNLTQYRVVLVGSGPQQEELLRLVQSNHLQEQFDFVGQQAYAKLGSYLRMASVLVLPTLADVWGMVIPEAMLFGRPVICSKQAGAAELIQDGVNGFCFDPTQPKELADLMQLFIEQPRLSVQMGHSACRCMKSYSSKAAARQLTQLTTAVCTGSLNSVP